MTKEVDGGVLLVEAEGRRVLRDAMEGAGFTCERLDEHANRHTRRERMRVNNYILASVYD
jgi:hypothetical protein